jgi:hypothetical protein
VPGRQDLRHLLTDRLDLRAIASDDADALHPLLADARNCAYIPEGPAESPEASRGWTERHSGHWASNGIGYWTVRLRPGGTVIGVGGAERRPHFWNLYYLLDWRHWGRGYGTELAVAARGEAPVVPSRSGSPPEPAEVTERTPWRFGGNVRGQNWRCGPTKCQGVADPGG